MGFATNPIQSKGRLFTNLFLVQSFLIVVLRTFTFYRLCSDKNVLIFDNLKSPGKNFYKFSFHRILFFQKFGSVPIGPSYTKNSNETNPIQSKGRLFTTLFLVQTLLIEVLRTLTLYRLCSDEITLIVENLKSADQKF